MQRFHVLLRACCATALTFAALSISLGAVTPEQKKELKEIGTEIGKVSSLTSKKKFDEAETALKAAEDRLGKLVKDAALAETDPALKPIRIQLDKAKAQLGKASGKGTVSFAKDVAPIFVEKCLSCHDDNARGGLRLDTFAGMEKGGSNGALLIAGNPQGSRLLQKLVTPNAQQRMPRGAEALNAKEIQAIGTWIAEGAKFDGADKASQLASIDKKPAAPPPKVVIARATGNEKVSFTRDIMPELMDTCGRCHNDNQKRSGLSVTSFEKLMQGGDSGRVIVAGSLEGSRLWRLVNGDDQPVMPAGNQTGITRKWYNNLKTWIEEGAKFDGDDPKKRFPSLEEREAATLAQLSPEQWVERRKKTSNEQWKKTFPNGEPRVVESKEFIVLGDVADERLKEIEAWAEEHLKSLRSSFNVKDEPMWKGKLTIFVLKERFGYEEFNNSVHRREAPREVIGHSQVTPTTQEDAFIALQDVGDAASETSPGMQISLVEHLTGAFLKRGGGALPDWVIRGAGLALAGRGSNANPYLAAMPGEAGEILKNVRIDKPEDVFANGTFSPGEVGPIGFTLVDFMLKRGGPANFSQFIRNLQSGDRPEAALRKVYGADGKTLAAAYASSLPAAAPKKGNKK